MSMSIQATHVFIYYHFIVQGVGLKENTICSVRKLCKSKMKGGVGIKDLTKVNISLLRKWWWKLEHEDDLWQKLVKAKYLSKSSIHDVSHKAG